MFWLEVDSYVCCCTGFLVLDNVEACIVFGFLLRKANEQVVFFQHEMLNL